MKKLAFLIIIFIAAMQIYGQVPYSTVQHTLSMGDSITPQFKPNFQVEYWTVSIKDTGNGSPATTRDSIIIWGQQRNGDTVLLGMRRVNKDTVTNILTYDYNILPEQILSGTYRPFQDFWVNDPTGIIAIWGERINTNNLSGRKTWVNFNAIRKIY
jgi:hypothetical protein